VVPLITSRRNPLVAELRALARRRTPESRRILLDGAHLIEAALAARVRVLVAVVARSRLATGDEQATRLVRSLADAGARVVAATEAVMDAISPVVTASGLVALAEHDPSGLESLLEREPLLIAWLHDVQDPGNVGAVVRAAEAAGATGVLVSGRTADPFGWKALRGSMGSTLRLPVVRVADTVELLRRLRRRAVRVLAATPRGGRPIYDVELSGSLVICLGSEGAGLPPELICQADEQVSVPMQPPVESLNVAVTAALLLYEARRQRLRAAPAATGSRRPVDTSAP
jgi:TrmH family RNA methyltransferase